MFHNTDQTHPLAGAIPLDLPGSVAKVPYTFTSLLREIGQTCARLRGNVGTGERVS